MGREMIRRVGETMPMLIVGYVVALAALRLLLSPNLEMDEAHFVGRVDFRLIYEGGQAPLYHWLMRLALELTGWRWVEAAALVKYGLLGAYHLLIWKIARRLVDERAAVMAVAASAFLPQILWSSAVSLSYSVAALVGVAAMVHATLRALQQPTAWAFAWLGAAASIGALAALEVVIFALPFTAVILADPVMRGILRRREALIAIAILAAAAGPTLAALLALPAPPGAAAPAAENGPLRWLDLPHLGVDGLASMALALLAWAGPAALVWGAARAWDARGVGVAKTENLFAETLGRAMLGALAAFAAMVLLSDAHHVKERDLTPLLAAAPVYMAIAWPLSRSASVVAALAAAAYGLAFLAFWGLGTQATHRFVYPYDRVAGQLRRVSAEPLPIIAERAVDRANLVVALGWPGATTPLMQPVAGRAVLLWTGHGEAPPRLIPAGFGAADKITTIVAPLKNHSGDPLIYRYQRFERLDEGAD